MKYKVHYVEFLGEDDQWKSDTYTIVNSIDELLTFLKDLKEELEWYSSRGNVFSETYIEVIYE